MARAEESSFAAEWMDGQAAVTRPVRLRLGAGGLEIVAEEARQPLVVWPLTGLVIEELAGDVVHLEHPRSPGALLASGDPALAPALARAGAARARAHGRWRAIALYGAGVLVAVGAIYAALPHLASALARRVPAEVEQRLAESSGDLFARYTCQDADSRRALDALMAKLARPGEPRAGPGALRVDVINFGMVNAFTTLGGRLAITRGLIAKAEGPDEVAGVLAHEIEHARQRHLLAHVIRSSILSFGWAITVGDFSGLFVVDPETMFQIVNQGFSRDDERAADAGALARLDAAGLSRAGFASFFQRLRAKGDGVPAWLTTHPDPAERLAAIGARPPGPAHVPALSPPEWAALKRACQGEPEVDGVLRRLFGD